MKKAITVLGLGAAAVAISVSNANAMEQAEATAEVNLREQPSATSNKVSEIQVGSKLKVISNQDGWTNVETEDGRNGWVSGYYVSNENANTDNKQNNVNIDEKVEIKTDNAENIESENVNQNVSNDVYESDFEVSSSSKENNIKTSENKETSIQSNAKLASTSYLNVRLGPSTSNGILGVIYKGEIFKVVSKSSNGWYKVVLNDGTTGWASGSYINLTKEVDNSNISDYIVKNDVKAENTAKTVNNNQGVVNSKVGLNIRSAAGMNGSVVGTLASNAVVNIVGEENGWYKIKLDNGSTGYVGASFISKSNTTTVNNANASNNVELSETAKVNNDNAKKNLGNVTASGSSVVDYAQSLLGTKYSWGGTTPNGFDCSGFTQYVYKNAVGISIPRVSSAQATAGSHVDSNNMKAGDLLYFDTLGKGTTSHVGIYMGNGKFIHASGSAAKPEYVKISNLAEKWVKLLGARRLWK